MTQAIGPGEGEQVSLLIEIGREHERNILASALQLYDNDLRQRITAMQQRRQQLQNGRRPEAHEPDADDLLLVIHALQERGRRLEAMTQRLALTTPAKQQVSV